MNTDQIEKKVFEEIINGKFDEKMFMKYLAFLLAIRDMYQSFHWGTSGRDFYEDHLLFEKLYNNLSEEADKVAEKFVGMCSPNVVCPVDLSAQRCVVYENIMDDLNISSGGNSLILRALYAESCFLNVSETLYDKLEESETLTLGMDDLLTSIYSDHEDNMYFLKQKVILERVPKEEGVGISEDES